MEGNPKENYRMNKGDQGALAIGEDSKVVHKCLIQFRLPGTKNPVTRHTAICD